MDKGCTKDVLADKMAAVVGWYSKEEKPTGLQDRHKEARQGLLETLETGAVLPRGEV